MRSAAEVEDDGLLVTRTASTTGERAGRPQMREDCLSGTGTGLSDLAFLIQWNIEVGKGGAPVELTVDACSGALAPR